MAEDDVIKETIVFAIVLIFLATPGYAEMFTWVDEKGTVHFVDDPSRIPEKYRPDAEFRKTSKEVSVPQKGEQKPLVATPKSSDPEGVEIPIIRRGEVSVTEVILNGRERQHFIIDTGASFTSISRQTAKDLGIVIDENTPFLPTVTASDTILSPLVTLRSVRVGKAEVENVDALVHTLPGGTAGLLGNSFLNKFRVVLDSVSGKMTLFPMQGKPSPDRPGGYGKDYWVGRFQFYYRVLEELKKMKAMYEKGEGRSQVNRVNNAIRYFENQLSELERKASFAGVPRNWRE
jgi:clan AA aspartic protease (TIGR02281 family)